MAANDKNIMKIVDDDDEYDDTPSVKEDEEILSETKDEQSDDENNDDDDASDIDDYENTDTDTETETLPELDTKNKDTSKTPNDIIKKFMEQEETLYDDTAESIDSSLSDDEDIKFDDELRKNQILNHHTDLVQSNFDEISALTKVVRDENGIIIDPIHKTIPILTKFERARILGLRSKQLSNGAEPFIKIPANIIQSHIIAEMELEKNVLPFIISRPLPNGKKEYWKLQDLEQIDY